MDELERRIVLPKGAYPLTEYGRYYALEGEGRIAGVYLLPDPPDDPSWTCEEVVLDGDDVETRTVPCDPPPKTEFNLKAGQRRWLGKSDRLPFRSHGGCSIVGILYDPATSRFEHVFCHGRS